VDVDVGSSRAGDSVALRAQVDPDLRSLSGRARAARGDLEKALALAADLGGELPVPATGHTLRLWESLATLGAADLTVARVVEPHLDALAILAEAEHTGFAVGAVWGVFAAEGGERLRATPSDEREWTLTGTKLWCSLADRISHALVTAWVDDSRRGLFAVDLRHPGVQHQAGHAPWAARGLVQVRSTGLEFDQVEARPVGAPGWYLERPGFAWGGIGVAAVWYGGAVAVARRLREASTHREPDQIALAHLGAVDVALDRARAVLVEAASVVDGPLVSAEIAARLALRARQVVADTVEEVLLRAGHALGPGPLATEGEHAGRVSDLSLYVRQHHAERDAAALGRSVLSDPSEGEWAWW
jgi:alkylation response protein AidB-like acyl-CoA dehydrogenase